MGERVFRDYDRAGLDAQYDNSAKVSDAPGWLGRYESASRETRAALDARLDVAFGPSPQERLDVFPAAGPTPAPVMVFIHGGYWMRLSKNEFSFVARGLVPRGAAVVVVDYALVPAVDLDELVRQCRAAVAWTVRNAASFGGNPARVHVSGHSAGGHLTAMVMATDWASFDAGPPVPPLAGGCGLSGLYDLEPIRACYLNDTLGLDPAAAARNSPVRLRRTVDAPLLLAVGGDEGPEFLRQSEDLAAAWRTGPGEPRVMAMPGVHHFSICMQLDDPDSDLARAVQRHMGLR